MAPPFGERHVVSTDHSLRSLLDPDHPRVVAEYRDGMPRKKWSDLSDGQKRAVFIGGAAETAITVAALRDLAHRPADEIRGSKAFWVLSFFVQPFGPIAYFAAARR